MFTLNPSFPELLTTSFYYFRSSDNLNEIQDKRNNYIDVKKSLFRPMDQFDMDIDSYVTSIDPQATPMTTQDRKENETFMNAAQVKYSTPTNIRYDR